MDPFITSSMATVISDRAKLMLLNKRLMNSSTRKRSRSCNARNSLCTTLLLHSVLSMDSANPVPCTSELMSSEHVL